MATPYLTPAQVRSRQPDLVSVDAFPDDVLAEHVEAFEDRVEEVFEVAWRPREATWTGQVRGGQVVLPATVVDPSTVVWTTSAGDEPVSADRVNGPAGVVALPGRDGIVTLTYTHGHTGPPIAVLQACALYVWHEAKAQKAPATNNAYARYNADAGAIERVSTAAPDQGRITGWMDVDRILSAIRPTPPGFA